MSRDQYPGHELQLVRMRVGEYLDAILGQFKPGAQVTLFVRNPEGEATPGAKDFVLSSDDRNEVAAMLARWFAAEERALPASAEPKGDADR
jgi:hypothetical protein